jgi:hypothetical protein
VASGVLQLDPFSAADAREARRLIHRHADLGISLADASIAVIAGRHKTQAALTLDERRVGLGGGAVVVAGIVDVFKLTAAGEMARLERLRPM